MTLTRTSDGAIELAAEACLPPAHVMVDWAQRRMLGGPEFVVRMFQVYVYAWLPVNDPHWHKARVVRVGQPETPTGCIPLATTYEVPNGSARRRLFTGSFLGLPGDTLRLQGFGRAVEIRGAPPERREGDILVWRGDPGRLERDDMAFDIRSPTPPSREAAETAPPPVRAALFAAWRDLATWTTELASSVLFAAISLAPIVLLLIALTHHLPDSPDPVRIRRARAGLWALVAFGVAVALNWTILDLTRWAIRTVGLESLILETVNGRWVAADLTVLIAVVVAIMVVPLIRSLPEERHDRLAVPKRALAAVISLALCVLAVAVLVWCQMVAAITAWPDGVEAGLLREAEVLVRLVRELGAAMGVEGLARVVQGAEASRTATVPAIAALALWLGAAALLFWAPVFWVLKRVASGGRFAGAALTAGLLVFLLPLLAPMADAAQVGAALLADPQLGSSLYRSFIPAVVRPLAVIGSGAALLLIVVLALRGLREIAAAMLAEATAIRLRRVLRGWVMVLIALVIVVPLVGRVADLPGELDRVVYRLMLLFQRYGLVLALLAPVAAFVAVDRALSRAGAVPPERFHMKDSLVLVAAAGFAGYLTLWIDNPISALVLMAIGWLVFRHILLVPEVEPSVMPAPAGLGQQLIEASRELRLLDQRKASLEKAFTARKVATPQFEREREELAKQVSAARASLPVTMEEARHRLLALGPGGTPVGNALIGAKLGLVVALVLQVLRPIDVTVGAAAQERWLAVLGAVVVDPAYSLIRAGAAGSELLRFVTALIDATAVWVIAGFLFGLLFHRIRGRDGFWKALMFSAGIAVPFMISLAVLSGGTAVAPENLTRFLPLLVFLLVLGTVVFDGWSLRRAGLGLSKLPEVYGLRTAAGYASFAGVLASAGPVLEFFDWVTRTG